MTVYKDHKGAWCISAIVNGHLVQRQYFFYTKREAIRLFKEYIRR